MSCAALVTAGGTGRRMGTAVPKQYLEIEGAPILAHTLKLFDMHPDIDHLVLTVPAGEQDFCKDSIVVASVRCTSIEVTAGGPSRQESVFNGLVGLREFEMVAIHDGVRPFVDSAVVSATIRAARVSGACIAGLPVRDTVKRQRGDYLETIERRHLWLAHTPQTFRSELIIHAHEQARRDGFQGTDDASLVERLGHTVSIVEDSPCNIKITTPRDLDIARRFFRSGNSA